MRLVALLQVSNDCRYLPEFLENVAQQVDGIIALDDDSSDGSRAMLESHPAVLEVIRVSQRGRHAWNEPRNRAILVDAAARHGAEWVVAVDADERLERHFRTRAEEVIGRGDKQGVAAYLITIRELWGSPRTFRVDGVWGGKDRARLFKVPEFYDSTGSRALHGYWPPDSARRADGEFALADLVIYHLAMIHPLEREARKLKYLRLDPDSRYQAMGYDYLTDETGLELAPVTVGRDFLPDGVVTVEEPLPYRLSTDVP